MKIAIYLPSFAIGGAERNIINLANEFASRGNEIILIVNTTNGKLKENLSSQIKLKNLNVKRTLMSFFGLFKILRKEKPDALLSTLYHANIISIFVSKFLMLNQVCIVRQENTLEDFDSSIKSKVFKFLISITYPYADGFIGISEGVVKSYVKFLPKRSIKIFNPAIYDNIEKLKTKSVSDKFNKNIYNFISVCRFTRQKNHELLIEAIRLFVSDPYVKNQLSMFKFNLIGDGPEMIKIKTMVKEYSLENYITFYGELANPYPLISHSDCYIMHSRWEGFGNSLVEGMYLTKNVITTNFSTSANEITNNGQYANVINHNLPSEMKKILIRAFKKELHEINCKEYLSNNFHLKKIATQYLSFINDAVKK